MKVSDLPLLIIVFYVMACGWHFGYLFAFVGESIQGIFGDRKRFKKWDFDAQKKIGEAKTLEELNRAVDELTKRLNEKREPPSMAQMRRELWWVEVHIAFPILNAIWVITIQNPLDVFFCAVNIALNYMWWKYHDHDDRWKKRRKKALAKVKEVGGKLVVVPAPAPS